MRLRILVSAFVMVACSLAARADSLSFGFSFGSASDVFAGSGVLTGTAIAANEFLITAVTGTTRTTVNGSPLKITGVEDPGGFEGNDNLLFSSNGSYAFDSNGLTYLLSNGAQINLFFSDGEFLERAGGKVVSQNAPISITPEPSSLALLGTGALGLIGAVRRRLA